MYILSETGGQTCNKYFQYLYYLKKCMNEGTKLRVQLPDYTIEDYPNLLNNKYISFPFYSHSITKLLGIKKSISLTRWFTVVFLNNYVRFIVHQLSFRTINFVSGKPTWTGTEEKYCDINAQLKFLFEPTDKIKKPIDDIFKINKGKVVCGIHMRGGDYKKWLDGKYFFEQSEYHKAAVKMISLFPSGNLVFFICSNDTIDKSLFSDLDYFTINSITPSQDIYALSKCDYLIGTLSSFNAWASLLGQVPLYSILNEKDIYDLDISKFSPVVNYKEKQNGWKFPRSKTFYANIRHKWLYNHSNKEFLLKLKY